jgi:hypothetical protein
METKIANITETRAKHLVAVINKIPGNYLGYLDASELIDIVLDYQKLSIRRA